MNALLLVTLLAHADGPALEGGQVHLTVPAYEKLKAAAAAAEERARLREEGGETDDGAALPATSPRLMDARISGVLSRKALTLDVSGTAEGSAGQWNVIPLIPASIAITDVTLGGGPASLISADSMTCLAFEGAGRRTFRLSLQASGGGEGGSAREVELSLLPGHSRQFSLELEGKMEPEVTPDALLGLERSNGRKFIKGFISANADALSIRWDTDAVAEEAVADLGARQPRHQEPARINVQSSILTSVGERLLTTYATLRYAIFHAPVSRFEFSIPLGAELIGVQGRGATAWTCAKPGPTGTLCAVDLPFPVQRTYELSIQLEQTLARELRAVDVAIPQAVGVQRQNGHVAVEVMGNAEVKPAEGCTATREDVRELPSDLFTGQSTPILLAFKYLDMPTRVALDIQRRESVETSPISVESASYTTVWTTEGRTITEATLQVRNRQRQFLAIQLPASAAIQSAFVADAPVKPSTGEDGRIRIPLRNQGQRAEQEVFVVQVVYIQDNLPLPWLGGMEAVLPALDAEVGALSHTVVLPDHQKLWAFGGDLSIESPRVVQEAAVHRSHGFVLGGAASPEAMELREAPGVPQAPMPVMAEKQANSRDARRQMLSNVAAPRASGGGMGAVQADDSEEQLQVLDGLVGNTGVLPVRIQIPQNGDRYTAHAFYVPANAALRWHARAASGSAASLAWLLSVVLGLLLGMVATRDRALVFRRGPVNPAQLMVGALVVLSALLAFLFRRQADVLPGFALLGALGTWTVQELQRRFAPSPRAESNDAIRPA